MASEALPKKPRYAPSSRFVVPTTTGRTPWACRSATAP
jgi:hypothetical protein